MGLLTRLCALLVVVGCAPATGPDPSRIEGLRVLAIQVEPPETRPGAPVTLTVTTAGGDAPMTRWAWCATPKPPTENTVVDPACLDRGVVDIPTPAASITAVVPADACRLFGPISPGPGLRARDADVTGGYYQPVRVTVGAAVAFGLVRLRCGLPQAPLTATQRYAAEYADNQNPVISAFEVPEIVDGGARVVLRISTDDPQAFLRFDPAARALVDETELLDVSWFSTAGDLAEARTRVVDGAAQVEWRAPQTGGVEIFAVLRDSRGGMSVREATVEVR